MIRSEGWVALPLNVSPVWTYLGAGLIVIGALGGACVVVAAGPRSLRVAAFVSLLCHLVLLGVIAVVGYGFFHVDDPANYDRVAVWLAGQWRQGVVPDLSKTQWLISSFGYYYWIAALYQLFGHHPLIVQLANVIFALAVGTLTFRIAKRLAATDHVAWLAAVAALFYPTLAIWSVMMLKDIFAGFLLLACIELTFLACERPAWWRWFALAATGYAVSTLRFYFGILELGIGSIAPLLLGVRPKRSAYAGAALLAFTLAASFGVGEGYWYLQALRTKGRVAQVTAGLARGGSSVEFGCGGGRIPSGTTKDLLPGVDPASPWAHGAPPLALRENLAVKIGRFFVVPLPCQGGSLLIEIGKVDWLFWWPLLILALFGMKRALTFSWQRTLIVVLPIAALVVFYADTIGNAGTLIRYRGALFPLFAVLGGLGLDELTAVFPARVRALWERFA